MPYQFITFENKTATLNVICQCLTPIHEFTVLADMPGITAKDLTIEVRDDVLTLASEVDPPECTNEVDVLREYETGNYVRQFNLSEVIDQSKIEADLKDGVLRLTLPKVEPAAPRKIKVKAA